jgi:hypothetical protein
MTQAARVFSIEDLEAFHASLARFGAQGQESLASAELEIRRCLETIQDRLTFWQREIHRRQEDVNRARSELAFKRSMSEGKRTGAVEQEIALAKAQARLREAEDKVVVCRRWITQLPQAINEYEGYARVLAGMFDGNLKQSLNLLQKKIAVLKQYAEMAPPTDAGAPTTPVPQQPAADAAEAAPQAAPAAEAAANPSSAGETP